MLIKDKIDVKVVYNKTKIIIIPSLCDETFCRVGYESMINKIIKIDIEGENWIKNRQLVSRKNIS